MDKLLLRPAEAAEVLGVSRSRLYEILSAGDLPTVQIGRLRRIPAEALRLWVLRQPLRLGKGSFTHGG